VLRGEFAHTKGAFVVKRRYGIGRGVELDVDIAHAVVRRPLDAILELDAAPEVDAYAFAQTQYSLLEVWF